MDLPQFTIMPTGLDDWNRIWRRREADPPQIHAPRLRQAVRTHMRAPNVQLRPFPWQPKRNAFSNEGADLGVPARVFPQWLRCTGCDMLGLVSQFSYVNTHPYRTDLARFEHPKCPGRSGEGKATRPAVPARYLLACVAGHLDEFPYDLWVHRGRRCEKAEFPILKMVDRTAGKGASATIHCASCGERRPMNEAQGVAGAAKLPGCRGRHPHLDGFEPKGCDVPTKLMLIGASNLWFPSTLSIGDVPRRLVSLTRERYPDWTVATEDRGEGVFLQLDEERVAAWEQQVLASEIWDAHKWAHRRNFNRRFSETAENIDADERLKPPRYWLVHTLAHVLIRGMAMECGYSAASLSERLYAWPGSDERPPAAGLLIATTASDSDGTLDGLVSLSEPARLHRVVSSALERAARCSSDPICARRTPADPEDFLHGAACHSCVMASETSCERANRFLDRRFLIDLPGSSLGFFE
jgi:hypothetical protein